MSKFQIDVDNEIWLEWKPGIMISNFGNVKGRKISLNSKGYLRLSYKKKDYPLHQLIGELFIPNPENKPYIDHIDRNRINNNISNLRWCTAQENSRNTSRNRKIQCIETGEILNRYDICSNNNNADTHLSRNIKNGWAINGLHYKYI